MSNLVLSSNLKSPLVLSSTDPSKVEVMSYEVPKSTGILVKNWSRTTCKNEPAAGANMVGKTASIDITRMGKWQLSSVRVAFGLEGTAPTGVLGAIGLRIADLQLWNFGSMLFNQDHAVLMARVNMLPLAEKMAVYQKALLLLDDGTEDIVTGTPNTTTAYCTYVPFLAPSTTTTRNNWDLEVLEPLIIKVTVNSNTTIGLVAASTIFPTPGSTFDAIFQTVDYEPEYKQQLYLENFGTQGLYVPYLSFDSETQFTVPTGVTTTTVKLATSVPAIFNHSYIRPVTTAVGILGLTPVFAKIHRINVKLNNQTYIENIPAQALNLKAEMAGSAGLILIENGTLKIDPNKIHTICWSDKPASRTSFSGCLAYGSIDLPEFVFTYATLIVADYEIVIVTEYLCEMLMSGTTGKIMKSIAS